MSNYLRPQVGKKVELWPFIRRLYTARSG